MLSEDKKEQIKRDIKQNIPFDKLNRLKAKYLQKQDISSQQFYEIYHDIETPTCICGNILSYLSFKEGFNKYCSITCANKYIIDNRKPLSIEISQLAQEKRKQTFLEKYGVENPSLIQEVKDKKQKTLLQNYDEKLSTIKLKISNTYHQKSEEEKENIVLKRKQTTLKRYGIEQNSNSHIKNKSDLNLDFILQNFVKDNYFLNMEFMEHFNIGPTTSQNIRKELGIVYPAKLKFGFIQNKIKEYFEYNDVKIESNITIQNKEIDLFFVDYNFGIEYDGLIWHSFGKTPFDNTYEESKKKYHLLQKIELFRNMGIQIFNIFENEWLDPIKQSIWKSVINSKIGKSKKLFARKCIIKEVKSKVASEFCKENHLQGDASASIRLGLYCNDELVALMTFGKSRFSKKYEYELIRFCSLQNHNVIGGASKMLKYFERNYKPKSIISYANRRWSQGNLYEKLGFKYSHSTEPNYFYFLNDSKEYHLLSRIQFQKHKIDFIPYECGYRKIYDCGNLVYFIDYND